MRLIDLIPGAGSLVFGAAYFVMTIISPLLALSGLVIGALTRSLEKTLLFGAVAGLLYQALNLYVQRNSLLPSDFQYFLIYGSVGAAAAGMAWAAVGYGAKSLWRARRQ